MEVHTHTHPSTGSGPRKKWTHYFWEFLMLFLAVFCGFLAENKREHIVEAHRARDYAKGLYNDIKHDTADLHKGTRHMRFNISVCDSIASLASRYNDKTVFPGHFYYYSRLTANTYPIDWSRSTLNQLIQSGNLRYFRNKNLVDLINRYYALQANIDGSSHVDDRQREVIRELRNKILDNTHYSVFVLNIVQDDVVDQKPDHTLVDSLRKMMLPLQKGGEQYLDEYFNHISERSVRFSTYILVYFSRALELANTIIKELESEYHLK